MEREGERDPSTKCWLEHRMVGGGALSQALVGLVRLRQLTCAVSPERRTRQKEMEVCQAQRKGPV